VMDLKRSADWLITVLDRVGHCKPIDRLQAIDFVGHSLIEMYAQFPEGSVGVSFWRHGLYHASSQRGAV